MVRKRYPWQRKPDRRRHRKRVPPPTSGFPIEQLAALSRVPRRTIADYLQRGLLNAPQFRGTATRYDREHLLRLLAIRKARMEGERSLSAIKQHLDRMGIVAIESWVAQMQLTPEVATALGVKQGPVEIPEPVHSELSLSGVGATWARFELLPGLELSARTDAGPLVEKVAQQLRAYVARLLDGGLQATK